MKKILLRGVAILIALIVFLSIYIYMFASNAKKVSTGAVIEQYENPNFALIVVDVQEATTGEYSMNPFYQENSEELITKINTLIEKFEAKEAPVIYVQNQIEDPLINFFNSSFAKGSEGVKLDKRLKIVSDFIVPKDRQDAFSNPELDEILIKHKVNKLYVVGLDAAYCINSTVKAANNRKYKITVIEEAVLSETDEQKGEFITQYKNSGYEVTSFRNILPE